MNALVETIDTKIANQHTVTERLICRSPEYDYCQHVLQGYLTRAKTYLESENFIELSKSRNHFTLRYSLKSVSLVTITFEIETWSEEHTEAVEFFHNEPNLLNNDPKTLSS